jgi:hypothetical protein
MSGVFKTDHLYMEMSFCASSNPTPPPPPATFLQGIYILILLSKKYALISVLKQHIHFYHN